MDGLSEDWVSIFFNSKRGSEISKASANQNRGMFDLTRKMSMDEWMSVTSFRVEKIGLADYKNNIILSPMRISPIFNPKPKADPNANWHETKNNFSNVLKDKTFNFTLREHADRREQAKVDAAEAYKKSLRDQWSIQDESNKHLSSLWNYSEFQVDGVANKGKRSIDFLFKIKSVPFVVKEQPKPVPTVGDPDRHDEIKNLSHSLYALNNGEIEDGMAVGSLHRKELDLIESMAKDERLSADALQNITGENITWDELKREDPTKVRSILFRVSESFKQEMNQIEMDRMYLKQGEKILSYSIANKVSLEEILVDEDKSGIYTGFRDMEIAHQVTQNNKNSGATLQREMQRLFSTTRFAGEYGMLNRIPFTENDLKTPAKFLSSLKTTLSDSYNPKTTRYPNAMRNQDLLFQFADAKSFMYDELHGLEADHRRYLEETRDTHFEENARTELFDHMYNQSEIDRVNALNEEESRRLLQQHVADGKPLPKKPLSELSRAIGAQFLQDQNSKAMKEVARQKELELRGIAEDARRNKLEAQESLAREQAGERELRSRRDSSFHAFWGKAAEDMQGDVDMYNWQKQDLSDLQKELASMKNTEDGYMPRYNKVQQLQRGQISSLYSEFISENVTNKRKRVITSELNILKGTTVMDDSLTKLGTAYDQSFTQWSIQSRKVGNLGRIVAQEGYDSSMNISPGGLKSLLTMLDRDEPLVDADGNVINFNASSLERKERNIDNKERWLQAREQGRTIRLDKSEVGYKVQHVTGDRAYLKREQLPVNSLTFDFNLDDEQISTALSRMKEREDRQAITREMTKEVFDNVSTGSKFVELVYNPDPVDESIGDRYGPYILEKIQKGEARINAVAPLDGPVVVDLTPQTITDMILDRTKRLTTPDLIQNDMKMSSYLTNMIQTHAPFILSDPDTAMGSVTEAAIRAVNEMSKGQRTIDITDEGMTRRWMETSFGPGSLVEGAELSPEQLSELEKFRVDIAGKKTQERIQDHVFMNILQKAHVEHFRDKDNRGRDHAIDSVVDMLRENANGQQPSADEVVQALRTPEVREFVADNKQYSRLLRMGVSDFDDYLASSDGIDERLFGDTSEIENINRRLFLTDAELEREAARVDRTPEQELRHLATKQPIAERVNESFNKFNHINHLQTAMDMLKEQNIDRVQANVEVPGFGLREAEVYVGSQGDIIASIPSLNKKFAIAENSSDGQRTVSALHSTPQTLHGEVQFKEDIGKPSLPRRDSYGAYGVVQRSGTSMIPSNPAVTVDEILKFYKGDSKMAYMDIETTGMNPRYIDEKYIQPLEIYAQKIQWDPEANELLGKKVSANDPKDSKKKRKEFLVTNTKGQNVVQDKHIFVSLTDETKGFVQDIIQNEDFMFEADGTKYSAIDYMTERNRIRNDELKPGVNGANLDVGHIRRAILNSPNASQLQDIALEKVEKLMFLQNIGKYAFAQERMEDGVLSGMSVTDKKYYNMYAGNTEAPNFYGLRRDGVINDSTPNAFGVVHNEQRNYLSKLYEHVGMASENLDNAGKRGKGKFMFASGQVGTDTVGMLKSITSFLGKAGNIPVVGQNVARADMGTLLNTFDKEIAKASSTPATFSGVNEILDASVALRSEIDDLRNDSFEELKTLTGQIDSDAVLSHDTSNGVDTFKRVDTWFDRVKQENGSIGERASNQTLQTIRALEGILDSTSIDDADAISITGPQRDLLEHLGLGEQLGRLDTAITSNADAVRTAQVDEVGKLQTMRDKFNNRPVVEQQFMSQWINPELKSHSSGSQLAKQKINAAEYHLAKNDVKANVGLIDGYMKNLSTDESFTSFDNSVFQSGDFVNMHTEVGGGALGLYQIDNVSDTGKAIDVSRVNEDGTRTPLRLSAPSSIELSRQFERSFDYVPGTDAAQVATDYGEDQARRSILNAMDNAYKFDLARSQGEQVLESGEFTHAPLLKLQEAYTGAKRRYDVDPDSTFNATEKIALQNMDMLGTERVMDMLDKTATPTQKDALLRALDYMDSALGQAQGNFLKDVEQLEQVGSINQHQKGNILKAWNDSIKEEGMRRGAKTTLTGSVNLGNFNYGTAENPKMIENIRMDLSNTRSIERSIWNLSNTMQRFVHGESEENARRISLRDYVAPMLQQKGIIQSDRLNSDDFTSVNQLVQEVKKNVNSGASLPGFEQFDPTQYKMLSDDAEFMSFLDTQRANLIQPHLDSLSPAQQAHRENIIFKEQYMRDSNMYVPGMTLKPDASEVMDILTDSLALSGSGNGRAGSMPINQLLHIADLMRNTTDPIGDEAGRNAIYGQLNYVATGGRNIGGMIPDIIMEKGPDSPQVRAMEAMNWITRNEDFNPSQARSVASNLEYMENPDISQHMFGNGDYAARTMATVPMNVLEDIAEQPFGAYTKDNQSSYLQGKIQDWRADADKSYYSHTGDLNEPHKIVQNENGELMTKRWNDAIKEQYRQQQGLTPEDVIPDSGELPPNIAAAPASTEGLHYEYVPRESIDSTPIPERAAGRIEEAISNTYQSARDTGRSVVEALDLGPGGAGRWVAGLGVAAFALSMFAKASNPLRMEERPQGHGVAGATGQQEDDKSYDGRAAGAQTPDTSGSTYVNSGDKGYTIKARGRANSGTDMGGLQDAVSQSVGGVNINVKDDRSSLDRSWLENQFTNFIDRGYVGEG